jgi:hypothetical protein
VIARKRIGVKRPAAVMLCKRKELPTNSGKQRMKNSEKKEIPEVSLASVILV